MQSHLWSSSDAVDGTEMHDARTLHSAGADPYAIYDQLPPVHLAPVQPATVWRRAFPTLTQLATTIRQSDARATAA